MKIIYVTEEMFLNALKAGDFGYCEGDCEVQKAVDFLNQELNKDNNVQATGRER